MRDSPGDLVIKNLPCNVGNVGLIPAWGSKIPHAMGQLSQMEKKKEQLTVGSSLSQLSIALIFIDNPNFSSKSPPSKWNEDTSFWCF